jgi:hypothetical protein
MSLHERLRVKVEAHRRAALRVIDEARTDTDLARRPYDALCAVVELHSPLGVAGTDREQPDRTAWVACRRCNLVEYPCTTTRVIAEQLDVPLDQP